MKSYSLKSLGNKNDYMTILRETDEGYVIRIVRDLDGYDYVHADCLSKELFDCCIRAGCRTEIKEEMKLAVNG